MSRTKRKAKQRTRDPRPGYARMLRLKHIRPGRIACFLFLEGSIALAVLLAFAELINIWTAVAIPVLVAVMVKMNDIIAGAMAVPAGDVAEDPLARQWDTDLAEDERDDEYDAEYDEIADGSDLERDDDAGLAEPAVAGPPRSAAADYEAEAAPEEYDDEVDGDAPGVLGEPEPDEAATPTEADEVAPQEIPDESEDEPDDDVDTDARHEGALSEAGKSVSAEPEPEPEPEPESGAEDETAGPAGGGDSSDDGAAEDEPGGEVAEGLAGDAAADEPQTASAPGERNESATAPEEGAGGPVPGDGPETGSPEVESELREHAHKRP